MEWYLAVKKLLDQNDEEFDVRTGHTYIYIYIVTIFAQISPEIHGLVVFFGDKVFVRIGQHNLKALLILSNKS